MSKWYPPEKEHEYKERFVMEDLTDLSAIVIDVIRRSGV